MTNADLFLVVFNGLMATELWAKPESEFLEWLNAEAITKEEPLTGHWIDDHGNDKCSVCGAMYSDLFPDYQNTHYCPNCGAKMIAQAVKP